VESDRDQADWPSLYYDSIEHLLWNPTWLDWPSSKGKKALEKAADSAARGETEATQDKAARKTVKERMQRLRRLEAPLHHAIHMFLTLAPAEFVGTLLDIEPSHLAEFRVANSRRWEHSDNKALRSAAFLCQPDVFLQAPGTQIAIEIKAGSKTSLQQILKYAFLMMATRPDDATRQSLVFVAPQASLMELLPKKERSPDLKQSLRDFRDEKLERKFDSYKISLARAKEYACNLDIRFRLTADMRSDVEIERQRINDLVSTPERDVYAKLLAGFARELSEWPRASASAAPSGA
jgi:hypothetical protein